MVKSGVSHCKHKSVSGVFLETVCRYGSFMASDTVMVQEILVSSYVLFEMNKSNKFGLLRRHFWTIEAFGISQVLYVLEQLTFSPDLSKPQSKPNANVTNDKLFYFGKYFIETVCSLTFGKFSFS